MQLVLQRDHDGRIDVPELVLWPWPDAKPVQSPNEVHSRTGFIRGTPKAASYRETRRTLSDSIASGRPVDSPGELR